MLFLVFAVVVIVFWLLDVSADQRRHESEWRAKYAALEARAREE